MKSVFDITDTVAVVTGTSGQLGKIWVEVLLSHGASVLCIDLQPASNAAHIEDWQQNFGDERVTYTQADVLNKSSLQAALAVCEQQLGAPSVLVNNAGIDAPPKPGKQFRLEDIPEEFFLPTMNVNVYGAFLCSQIFGGAMVEAGGGSIINVGSLYASVSPDETLYSHLADDPPFIKAPAYGASKAALLNLTRYMSTHWGKHSVRVNMLSPGGVLGGQDEKFKEKFCARVPLRRMALDDDLAGPLLFLASDASAYVTGTNLQIDGGFTAW